MLRSRVRHAGGRDGGASIIEMLVVVALIGILLGAATLSFRSQRITSWENSVRADLKVWAAGADQHFDALFYYPTTLEGFAQAGKTPKVSEGNDFRAFVVRSGVDAGYVIFGKNANTDAVFVISSWVDGDPQKTSLTALPDTPPSTGQYGVPATVTPQEWNSTAPISPTAATSVVVPFSDPAFRDVSRTTLGTGDMGQIRQYANPTTAWRIVDATSPVATRAIEFVTDVPGSAQGVWLTPQVPAPSWPSTQPDMSVAGQVWTVSAWVKGATGTQLRINVRTVNADGSYVSQSTPITAATMTGDWQRISASFTSPGMVGTYAAVEVTHASPYPAGLTFLVTAPQIEQGPLSPFVRQ